MLLNKGASAQGHDLLTPGLQLPQQFTQRLMLCSTKFRFSGVAKDFRDRAPLTPFDPLVKVLERPTQAFAKSAPDGCFARAHKPNQHNSLGRALFTARRNFAAADANSNRFRIGLQTPLRSIRFALGFDYCFSERFLRWILPLKLRSTTVEDTAIRPMVPAKARPLSMGK